MQVDNPYKGELFNYHVCTNYVFDTETDEWGAQTSPNEHKQAQTKAKRG
jgi:heme-binding NEAT domain protein